MITYGDFRLGCCGCGGYSAAEVCCCVEVEEWDADALSWQRLDDPRRIIARRTARLVSRYAGDPTGRQTSLQRTRTATTRLIHRQHYTPPRHTDAHTVRSNEIILPLTWSEIYFSKTENFYAIYIHLYSPKLVAIQQTNYKHNTMKKKKKTIRLNNWQHWLII